MKKKTNTAKTRASRGVNLDAKTREICKVIAKRKDKEGKKATAILLISDGMKQAEAAHASGLSVWQIRYLLARFRKSGTGVFKNATELIDSSGIGERKQKRAKKEEATPLQETKAAPAEAENAGEEMEKDTSKKDKKNKKKDKKKAGKKKSDKGKKGKEKEKNSKKKKKSKGKKKDRKGKQNKAKNKKSGKKKKGNKKK